MYSFRLITMTTRRERTVTMAVLWWFLVQFMTFSSVTSKGVFDSITSPTFMQPLNNASSIKSDDLFGDFFDKPSGNDSFANFGRSMANGGAGLMNFNFSAVVPMSRSSSSTRVMSSHTSTNSQQVSNFPKQSETQGVNLTKVVENVQLVMPKSAPKTFTRELNVASIDNPGGSELFGFNGLFAEQVLYSKLSTTKPQTLKGVTDTLSKVHPAGQYFVVFPVKSSEAGAASSFYVVGNALPAKVLSTQVGYLLNSRTPRGGTAKKQ